MVWYEYNSVTLLSYSARSTRRNRKIKPNNKQVIGVEYDIIIYSNYEKLGLREQYKGIVMLPAHHEIFNSNTSYSEPIGFELSFLPGKPNSRSKRPRFRSRFQTEKRKNQAPCIRLEEGFVTMTVLNLVFNGGLQKCEGRITRVKACGLLLVRSLGASGGSVLVVMTCQTMVKKSVDSGPQGELPQSPQPVHLCWVIYYVNREYRISRPQWTRNFDCTE